jgi:hypothetical protein
VDLHTGPLGTTVRLRRHLANAVGAA